MSEIIDCDIIVDNLDVINCVIQNYYFVVWYILVVLKKIFGKVVD